MRDEDVLEEDRPAATRLRNSAERFASRQAYAAFRPASDPEHIRHALSPHTDAAITPASVVVTPELAATTMLPDSPPTSHAAPKAIAPAPVAALSMPKGPYPHTAAMPTQAGPRGIRYDFNFGARLVLPIRSDGATWRVRLRDLDTGNTLFETTTPGATVHSAKRYYLRFGLEVWDGDADPASAPPVFAHQHDCTDRDVLIQFPVGTLGDIMAWFPYAARFAQRHRCRLTVAMGELIIPLFRDAYPHIRFATHDEVEQQGLAERAYATYSLGLFFDDTDHAWQPTDFRHVGLHRTAGYILGVDPDEERPTLGVPDEGRPIAEPYVCIAAQSSSQAKYWNNPHGWREVVRSLKAAGYRVICIDQKAVHGTGLVWNHVPYGAEDETSDRPLAERVRWLRHAALFVGTSSGLSWLAWAANCPVVMISGFTHPTNEFATPFRVVNWHVCNSCWNDVRHRFVHADFLWCPRHANTDRQFECTKLITPEQVIATIRQVPGYGLDQHGQVLAGSGAPARNPARNPG